MRQNPIYVLMGKLADKQFKLSTSLTLDDGISRKSVFLGKNLLITPILFYLPFIIRYTHALVRDFLAFKSCATFDVEQIIFRFQIMPCCTENSKPNWLNVK